MKKKTLTLFLAFAIMMTFMPSMAFAEGNAVTAVTVNFETPTYEGDTILIDQMSSYNDMAVAECRILNSSGDFYWSGITTTGEHDPHFKAGDYTLQFVFTPKNPEDYFVCEFYESQNNYIGTVIPGAAILNVTLEKWVTTMNNDGTLAPKSEEISSKQGNCLVVEYQFTVNPAKTPKKQGLPKNKLVTIAAIAAAVVGTVAVVAGSALTGGSNTTKMQQAAFQAKVQQQMVQKQVATIKTVLKGAGVVLSLASFGSSLGNLFQLNQFGFNPFGLR